ncbi:hypothetical protein DCAR_0728147 [Daucus carota subsp. sativus]|uniref:Protein kinase domain-containing protein n=1 Tax=Daucus carota subsp. sativus TaxID=79200 RepID=A0AAF0XLL3_DAUCS|nr:hypothetical protein DCAR_0728147 [Daucus carota subsp. sativus]
MGLIFCLLALVPYVMCQVTEFISIDCGGSSNYTDLNTGLPWISDSGIISSGQSAELEDPEASLPQYRKRRDFPVDDKKYCYTLRTQERRRYLVRATFLYGNSKSTFPKFQVYLDATKWSTVSITNASEVHVEEMIIRAQSNSVDVCLCQATTGSPFISTLELRPLNQSMYATEFEDEFYLKVAARVNFGATILILKEGKNFLVGVAPGTERVNTTKYINTNAKEHPPLKVMQTAVVGTKGNLTYRLNLEDFPASARGYAYFAEIEEFETSESRKFTIAQPEIPDYNTAVINIAENAHRSYTLYEPSFKNVTLDFVLSFSFVKTPDSTHGPLLNAIEISKYVPIAKKTDVRDVNTLNSLRGKSMDSYMKDEARGDPCVPTPWDWVNCSTSIPPRITKIALSGRNVEGEIPPDLNNMDGLIELWLNGSSFEGPIPDMTNLINLQILNNKLTDVDNNSLTGDIPSTLLKGKLILSYEGNPGLRDSTKHKRYRRMIVGVSIGLLAILLLLFLGTFYILYHLQKRGGSRIMEKNESRNRIDEEVSYHITFADIEEFTKSFSKQIGKGSFGPVYFGEMKDGKDLAVEVMADSSIMETDNLLLSKYSCKPLQVARLSRIHHRNLVSLIGYCKESHQSMLVYEYMHNGTLRDHIHDSSNQKSLDWLSRLQIAEDAAKGLEYLHSGCNPSIIHGDVKTSNILLDINMRAKLSHSGLSRQTEDDQTHVSSLAQGTVGYLDPGYYANKKLTKRSDVYSFGVVLLELVSGRKPVSTEDSGTDWNIVHWARSMICKRDVKSIVDPSVAEKAKIESVWRIAEVAIQCVEQRSSSRPRMQDIILAIQDAIKIEKGSDETVSGNAKSQSSRRTLLTSFLDIESPELSD